MRNVHPRTLPILAIAVVIVFATSALALAHTQVSFSKNVPAFAHAAGSGTKLASVNGKGLPLDRRAGLTTISGNGRYTAFTIDLGLQPHDTLPESDIWMYDAKRGKGERISGNIRNRDDNFDASVSRNGRYTAFNSDSNSLVDEKTDNGHVQVNNDIFVYDRKKGRTEWVSHDAGRGGRNDYSPAISADGRYVAFVSNSNNLPVREDLGGGKDYRVYVYDRKTGKTKLVSRSDDDQVSDESAWEPSISADGRYIAYYSRAHNLAGGQADHNLDVFRYDTKTKDTELISVDSGGTDSGNEDSKSPSISADGNRIAFTSVASDLVAADGNGNTADVFVRDTDAGTTTLVSVPTPAVPSGGDGDSNEPSISGNGRFVAFSSEATNLVAGDGNGASDVFRHSLAGATTDLVSTATGGGPGNDDSFDPAISDDGSVVAFASDADDLSADDGKMTDVFVHTFAP